MGGVIFLSTPSGVWPLVWQHRFSSQVCHNLITSENPKGYTTFNNFKLGATIVQHDVITSTADI